MAVPKIAIFHQVHHLPHPGPRSTAKTIEDRFIWPKQRNNIMEWSKACLKCQKAKVGHHTRTPLGEFENMGRFAHMHLDIVGPLPPSTGCNHVITMIDRETRWPEAIPTNSITAEKLAEVVLGRWVSRFGAPTQITTNQGRQFETDLFQKLTAKIGCKRVQLTAKIGCKRVRTTSYHRQSNGKIERWYRSLKAAIRAYGNNERWTEILPLILLELRSAGSTDTGVAPAQLTYGTQLRLPGDFFAEDEHINDARDFVDRLANALQAFASQTRKRGSSPIYVPATLDKCSHTFLRAEAKAFLDPP